MNDNEVKQNNNENSYNFDFANQVENNVTPNTPVQATTPVEPVQVTTPVEPVQASTPVEPVQAATSVEPVQAATPVEATSQQTQEDDEELIKDKKATKRFLIIVGVIIALFIIALPFIFKVAG